MVHYVSTVKIVNTRAGGTNLSLRTSTLTPDVAGLFPFSSILSQQLIGLIRTPTTSSIVRKLRRHCFTPGLLNWIDHSPPGLHLICALKQSRIADHAIVEKPLIARA